MDEARARFGSPRLQADPISPDNLPTLGLRYDPIIPAWAGLIIDGELIDGNHRLAALMAWAEDSEDRLDTLVSVVQSDDGDLLDAVLDATDAGNDPGPIIIDALTID